MLRFGLASDANVGGVLSGDLGDREFGGGDDCDDRGVLAAILWPAQGQSTGALLDLEHDLRVMFEPQSGGLEYRRDGCADDVLAVHSRIGMPVGKNRGQPFPTVPAKGYDEHPSALEADLGD